MHLLSQSLTLQLDNNKNEYVNPLKYRRPTLRHLSQRTRPSKKLLAHPLTHRDPLPLRECGGRCVHASHNQRRQRHWLRPLPHNRPGLSDLPDYGHLLQQNPKIPLNSEIPRLIRGCLLSGD